MMANEPSREQLVLVSHGDPHTAEHGQRIALYAELDAPAIREWTLPVAIEDTAIEDAPWQEIFAEEVADWGVGGVLVGWDEGRGGEEGVRRVRSGGAV